MNSRDGMRCRTRSATKFMLSFGIATFAGSMFGLAQTPPQGAPPAPPEVMEPPTENPAPPSDPSTGEVQPKEPLSKELNEGEGVLEPPRGVDPEMQKQVPDDFEGKTPVIPPPGEPGGRQDVQPK
jgi:hypothetical protein